MRISSPSTWPIIKNTQWARARQVAPTLPERVNAFDAKMTKLQNTHTSSAKKWLYYRLPSLATLGTTFHLAYMQVKEVALHSLTTIAMPDGTARVFGEVVQGLTWGDYGLCGVVALLAAALVRMPIHTVRWANLRVKIRSAAKAFNSLIEGLRDASDPQEKTRILCEANALRNSLNAVDGPLFSSKTSVANLFVRSADRGDLADFIAMLGDRAVRTEKIDPPKAEAAEKTTQSGADILRRLSSSTVSEVEDGLISLMLGAENGPAAVLRETARRLEQIPAALDLGQNPTLARAFPNPQVVLTALETIEKPDRRAVALVQAARGRGIPLGDTIHDLIKTLDQLIMALPPKEDRAAVILDRMLFTLTRIEERGPRPTSLANLVEQVFPVNAEAQLEEVKGALRKTSDQETVNAFIALFRDVHPEVPRNLTLSRAARIFRRLAAQAKTSLPLQIENADAIKGKVEALKDKGATREIRDTARVVLALLEEEIAMAPTGGGGGGGAGGEGASAPAAAPARKGGKG